MISAVVFGGVTWVAGEEVSDVESDVVDMVVVVAAVLEDEDVVELIGEPEEVEGLDD